ncbi:MAG: hypothetical protein K6U80_10035 [Firmicutes bacterium]|nr:hypothetical protein [Bacillota bacterium]
MILILAGWFTLGLALLWERLLAGLGLGTRYRVGYAAPISEELLKYIAFNFLSLAPLAFYGIFGLGEGLFEAWKLKKPLDFLVIFSGFATHFIFGLFFLVPGPGWVSLLLAITGHIIWNNLILNMTQAKP